MRGRTVLAAAVLALAGCGGAATGELTRPLPASVHALPTPVEQAESAAGPDERAPLPETLPGLQDALDGIASAFAAGDPQALRPWLYDPDSAFGRRWLDRAVHLGAVPLGTYDLRLDRALPDLATSRVRDRYAEPVVVAYVVEEHSLQGGYDPLGPAEDDLFLTAVRTDDGWRIAGDRDAEPLGLVSADHLWDQGPVVAVPSGPILVLHHPETPAGTISTVVAEARAALEEASDRWPLEWPQRVPILVPRDQDELAQLLNVTFDLSNFVAFASASPRGERGQYTLTGTRVVLNTEVFLDRTPAARQRILVHELLHVATRAYAGPATPSWVEEGVAQALGERRSATGTGLLDGLLASGRQLALPTDGQFTVGDRDRIFLSYQLAWSFVDHLVRTHGADQVARFYATLGRDAVGEPGTERWHVRRAAREAFGATLDELVQAWQADVR